MAAVARLNRIWRYNTISFASKFKLCMSLVTSILRYGCETWTLLADSEKRMQALKTKRLTKLLCISYLENKTNDWVRSKIKLHCGFTGTSSGNCQGMETCMVRACHTPRQPLQNHPLGHLGGWATPWSAEEMLD